MARRGWGGRQGSAFESMGMDRADLNSIKNESLTPRERYPPLSRLPLPLPKEKDEYSLILMQNFIDHFQKSKFYSTTTKTENMYQGKLGMQQEKPLNLEWQAFPRSLWPLEYKKKVLEKQGAKKKSAAQKRKQEESLEDILSKKEWLEKRMSRFDKTEDGENEEKDTSGGNEEELRIESDEDDEMDEGTDYQMAYGDDDGGDDFNEDDALSDEGII